MTSITAAPELPIVSPMSDAPVNTVPISTLFTTLPVAEVPSINNSNTPVNRSTVKSKSISVMSNGTKYMLQTIPGMPDIWYLHNYTGAWCIPNGMLAKLLNVKEAFLRKLGEKHHKGGLHFSAPSTFFNADSTSTKRRRVNKLYMWAATDVQWLLDNRYIRDADALRAILETYPAFSFLKKQETTPPARVVVGESSPAPASPVQLDLPEPAPLNLESLATSITGSALAIHKEAAALEAKAFSTRAEVISLRKENLALRTQLAALTSAKAATSVQQLGSSKPQPGFNMEDIDSLNKYLSKVGTYDFVEDLVKAGLFNVSEIYSMNSAVWTDPRTGTLVNKCKFQEILRTVFHTAHSSKGAPSLRSRVMRENYAAVCKVRCAKVPNKLDEQGQPTEKDNPAYTSNTDPCIRHQVRYTSKAIEYLRANWSLLISAYYDRIDEQV